MSSRWRKIPSFYPPGHVFLYLIYTEENNTSLGIQKCTECFFQYSNCLRLNNGELVVLVFELCVLSLQDLLAVLKLIRVEDVAIRLRFIG